MSDRNPYPSGPSGPGDSRATDERSGGSRRGGPWQRIALSIGAAVIVALAVALALILLGREGEAETPSVVARDRSVVGGDYAQSVKTPIERLTDSALVTGRALSRASTARDVDRISRMATQQLAVV